jgi:hypothetical protein
MRNVFKDRFGPIANDDFSECSLLLKLKIGLDKETHFVRFYEYDNSHFILNRKRNICWMSQTLSTSQPINLFILNAFGSVCAVTCAVRVLFYTISVALTKIELFTTPTQFSAVLYICVNRAEP